MKPEPDGQIINIHIVDVANVINKAKEESEKVNFPYTRSAYFYYLTRYFVSFHEAKFATMPTQTLNEYRNALDHFIRHMSSQGNLVSVDDEHKNVHKMEAHLQRGLLDVCKEITYRMIEKINKLEGEKESFFDILRMVVNEKLKGDDKKSCLDILRIVLNEKLIKEASDKKKEATENFAKVKGNAYRDILRMVSNGEFIKEASDKKKEATENFVKAKFNDIQIGEEKNKNDEIVNQYMIVVEQYIALEKLWLDNDENIRQAQILYGKSKNLSWVAQIGISIVGGIIVGVILTMVSLGSG